MEHNSKLDPVYYVHIQVGCYAWCYNSEESGYFLTNDKSGEIYSAMILIEFDITPKETKQFKQIRIIDEIGHVMGHTQSPLSAKKASFFVPLKYVNPGSQMKIQYGFSSKEPTNKIFGSDFIVGKEETVKIPEIEIMGQDKGSYACSICCNTIRFYKEWLNVLGKNKKTDLRTMEQKKTKQKEMDVYITPCGHMFHQKCIWSYLKINGYLRTTNCHTVCKHGEKCIPFNCPVCSNPLEQYSK